MSMRLQVIVSESEVARARRCAEAEGVNLSEWVRRAMALAEKAQSPCGANEKLAALRRLSDIPDAERGPAPPIEQMLQEINSRYEGKPGL
ncbi:MAG: hypothetical protein WCK20_08095 [Thermoleophilia bacterium]